MNHTNAMPRLADSLTGQRISRWFWPLLSLCALLSCLAVQAAEPATRFKHLSIEQGLSQNSVFSIIQDHKGFFWFATQDGLNRYDGYEFKVFRHNSQDPASISHNFILSIYQDSNKVLWIGTQGGGLNRFDPQTQRFEHFRHQPSDPGSLSHDNVSAIHEDRQGRLWIGTNGGGLNRFNRQTRRFVRFEHHHSDPHSLSNNHIMAMVAGSNDSLWLATDGGGLNQFDSQSGRFIHFSHQPDDPGSLSHNRIKTVYKDSRGKLWVGTRGGGLDRFDPQTRRFSHFTHDPANPNSLSDNRVFAIREDHQGRLWFGTEGGGLNRFDQQHRQFVRFSHDPSDPHSLGNNRIWSLYEDAAAVLWIGTRNGGISKTDPRTQHFGHVKQRPSDPGSLSHNFVRAIYEDKKGSLWIGTDGGGLNRFDAQSGQFSHFRHNRTDPHSLAHDNVQSILEDSHGMLWLGTLGGGLDHFDADTGRFNHYRHDGTDPDSLSHDRILTIFEDSRGDLWIGTDGGGMNRFDRQSGRFEHFRQHPSSPYGLGHDTVTSIVEDHSGSLWLGTDNGLNRYDPQSGRFSQFKHRLADGDSLGNNLVTALYVDKNGVLWIGTAGGLNRFDEQNARFIRYSEKDGLANDHIYAILEDDAGHLWFSTNQGLSSFNPLPQTFKNYDVNDGLQSNEFNQGAGFKSVGGELFFGGINGFNRFFPHVIQNDTQIPAVVLTDFLLANQTVPIARHVSKNTVVGTPRPFTLSKAIDQLQQLTLTYRQNLMSFEFAALHFADPAKNQYAYQLQGWDKNWIFTDGKNRRATYTNIPPGHYTLRIRASNKDGYWNEQGRSLHLTLLPPPWQSRWAYVLYALLPIGLIFVLWHIQRKKISHEHALNRQLESKVARRTAKLVQAEKMASLGTLTAGVAHEINNPTNFVQVSAQNLEMDLGQFEQFLLQLAGKNADNSIVENFHQHFTLLHDHLATINNGTERIKAIVQDLRAFTQQDPATQKTVNITRLLQSTINLVQTKYLEVTEFITDFDSSPSLRCYPAQLNQVFMHLIVNACDAIREKQLRSSGQKQQQNNTLVKGKIIIGCRLMVKNFGEKHLEITIKDNGCGMTAKVRSELFEPTSTSKENAEGTGLGLPIALAIVQKHQGELSVQSEPGLGSVFRLRLPYQASATTSATDE